MTHQNHEEHRTCRNQRNHEITALYDVRNLTNTRSFPNQMYSLSLSALFLSRKKSTERERPERISMRSRRELLRPSDCSTRYHTIGPAEQSTHVAVRWSARTGSSRGSAGRASPSEPDDSDESCHSPQPQPRSSSSSKHRRATDGSSNLRYH